jgi:uncharacterized protein DUF5666
VRLRAGAGWHRLLAAAAAVMLLNGSQCSFGSLQLSTGVDSNPAQTTSAPISAFGSVFVAGTEFTTGSGTLTLDGVPGVELQLRPGQVASVVGTIASGGATGTSTSLAVSDKLIGPVSATDPASGSLAVLGATVQVTGDTSVGLGIIPADVAGLARGDVVVVDGYRTSTGLIAARLDRAQAGQELRVAGPVSNLDGFGLQFQIGATTIDYSKAAAGLPPLVTNGSYVIARGGTATSATRLQVAQVTTATESPGGANGDSAIVHGAVTRFGSSSDFDVAGQAVRTSASTAFSGGTAADVAADRELEVQGQYDRSGTLVAISVTLTPVASFRVVGPVASLDAGAATLVVAGLTLTTGARTLWDDLSAAALHVFGFGNLAVGDWVEVRGVAGVAGAATVRVIERRVTPTPSFVELQGVPSVLADPALTLSGIAVDARTASCFDAAGHSVSCASLFAAAGGRVVRVVGSFVGATLTAQTVTLRP